MDDSGTRKGFPGGGMRDTAEGKPRFELLWTEAQPYEDQMLTRAALWMARGAEKYESRNWELFDSPEALEHAKASLLRHTFKLLAGETDEDHAAAVWFNAQVIEYVRWKFRRASAEILGEAAQTTPSVEDLLGYDPVKTLNDAALGREAISAPRYWRTTDGYYYRWQGDELTTIRKSFGRWTSMYTTVEEFLSEGSRIRPVEVPADEVPEWAR